jgi:hypothetical protein
MATIDLSRFAVAGATRPDSFSGLDPEFLGALQALFGAAPPEIQAQMQIMSAFRSPERQRELWEGALAKYGSPQAARKWVAPPGNSFHNKGQAVDLRYLDDAARAWAHENAAAHGLHFPMKHEPWHIEPVGARGGQPHRPRGMEVLVAGGAGGPSAAPAAPQAPGTPAPAMPPAREVREMTVAGPRQMAPAPQAPVPAAEPGPEGGFGSLLAALGSSMGAGGAMAGSPSAEPASSYGSGDPMGATMAAMRGSEAARGLAAGLMPDVERLMGLGKRRQLVG